MGEVGPLWSILAARMLKKYSVQWLRPSISVLLTVLSPILVSSLCPPGCQYVIIKASIPKEHSTQSLPCGIFEFENSHHHFFRYFCYLDQLHAFELSNYCFFFMTMTTTMTMITKMTVWHYNITMIKGWHHHRHHVIMSSSSPSSSWKKKQYYEGWKFEIMKQETWTR